jgi:hypothetical protein
LRSYFSLRPTFFHSSSITLPSQDDHEKIHTSSDVDGWLSVFERYKKLDEVWTEDLNKYIDTLLVFVSIAALQMIFLSI